MTNQRKPFWKTSIKANAYSKTTKIHSYIIVVLIVTLIIVSELASNIPGVVSPLEKVELSAHDTAVRLRGKQPPIVPIAIIAIDDNSLNYTGMQWPWPRSYLAQIVETLNKAGAKVIGYDVFLFEPDPDPEGDKALALAFARAKASVTVMQIIKNNNTETLNLPLKPYLDVLDGLGITEITFDDDAIVRSIQAYNYSIYNDQFYYNWAFEVARLYLGTDFPSRPTANSILFNNKKIPLYNGRLLINFSGPPQTYGPYYSAHQVILGDYPPENFRDKIVLIGATSVTLQDIYPTPFFANERMPGVEVVANAVNSIVSGNYYIKATPLVNVFIIIATAILAWLINRNRQPIRALVIMAISMSGYIIIWYFLFTTLRLQTSLITPEAMLLFGVIVPTTNRAISEELEKRRVRTLFSRFISPQMVDQLIKTSDISSLNKRARLTILFSDIRGFTSISEKLSPEAVVSLLNPYLSAMTEVIHNNGGTIDKYEGDAIVAFFGEPLQLKEHAKHAVQAACEMQKVLVDLRQQWLKDGVFVGKFEIGIGINTGEVFVGMLGSEYRVNYTVIGDSANLAARLQDQTKEYNCPMLISGETYNDIKDEYNAEFLDNRLLKGKSEPVAIYKLLGPKNSPVTGNTPSVEGEVQ